MLPADQLLRLRDAAGEQLAELVQTLYPFDEALGLHVVDRRTLAAAPERLALEAGVAGAGLAAVRFTNPESCFQYYDMMRLWADIGTGLAHDIPVLHLAPPPIRAGEIFELVEGHPMPETAARIHLEDMRSRHAGLWGRAGGYITHRQDVLAAIARFVATERAAA
jgi:hypothetical protein